MELALVLPVFLLLVFGIIDLGMVIWANDTIANAAREGARYASVTGNSQFTPTTSKADIRTRTQQFVIAGGQNIVVTVCYSAVTGTACSGNTDAPGAYNARGALVTVRVSATVPILTGSLLGLGSFAVSGTSSVLVNN